MIQAANRGRWYRSLYFNNLTHFWDNLVLKSTYYVNLLWLCQNSPLFSRTGELLFSLYFRYYTQTFFFVTRLIINKINQVQWVDFKLENVLVSLHSLKTMGLGPFGASAPLFLRNGELLGHSPIHNTFLWRHTIVWTVDYF
jgi:hypothetical protein